MRSRFSAYALGLAAYIIETTDPAGPMWQEDVGSWKHSIESFAAQTEFVNLEIVDAPRPSDSEGTVHFKATLQTQAGPDLMDELSVFRRADGRWRYHSGTQPG